MDNQLIDQCLESLAAGESLEACLEKYPKQRQELEPLLRAALRLRAAKAITAPPHLRQSGRQRLFDRIEAESRTASKQAGWAQSWQNLVATLQQRLLTPALAPVVLVLAILFLGTTATAYAAQSALPTSPIYPLKRLTETVRISLASDPLEQRLQFAGRRLNEAQALQSSAQQAYIPQLIKDYEQELRFWREQSEEKGLNDRARALSQLEIQLSTLQQLGSQAPAEQKALIEQQEQMLTSIIRNIGPSTTPSTSATPSPTPTPTPAITPTPLLPLSSNESPTPTATSEHDADESMTTPTDTYAEETRTPTITREHRPHDDMMTTTPTPSTSGETPEPTVTREHHPRGGGSMMTPSPTLPTNTETPAPTATPEQHPRGGGSMMTPSPTPPTGDETSAPTATPEQHPRGGGSMMTPSPTPPTGDETPVPTPTPQHHPRRGMN